MPMSGVPGSEFESSDEVEILAATSIHRDQETGDDAAECTPKPCSKSLTADHALRRSTGRAQLSSLAANRPTRSSRKCETRNVRSAAPARLPTPARQLPLTCLTGRLLRARCHSWRASTRSTARSSPRILSTGCRQSMARRASTRCVTAALV